MENLNRRSPALRVTKPHHHSPESVTRTGLFGPRLVVPLDVLQKIGHVPRGLPRLRPLIVDVF